jgi:AbrB family looped-hinge helix DNA binding protein
MEQVTVSSKGQIAIPKAIRDQMGLRDGTKLNLEVRGGALVLSRASNWREMRGMIRGASLTESLERERELDKQLEDRRD